MKEKIAIISGIMPVVIILDLITKSWALRALSGGPRIELFGGLIPLTLAFNRGAAFGLSLGNNPRWFFIPITVLALILLIVLLTQAQARDWPRFVSVSLVISGALGNLYDRVRWNRGVVDFIGPIDLGVMHWPPSWRPSEPTTLRMIASLSIIFARRGKSSQIWMPGTFVSMGRNSPRISAGAFGFGSQRSMCDGPPGR